MSRVWRHDVVQRDARFRYVGSRGQMFLLSLSLFFSLFGFSMGWAEENPIDVNAEHLDFDQTSRMVSATGKVRIDQPGMLNLQADQASYALDKRELQAKGNIRLVHQENVFTADHIRLDIGRYQGTLGKSTADLSGPGGRITSEQVVFHSQDLFTLHDATYTNCDCAPNTKPAWALTAKTIEMDRLENSLTATNVQLRLGDVPVFWVPWWQHPFMPKRKSGLLLPVIQAGGGNGIELDLPYYWNIAPERDATLTLHPTSRRGVLTKLQYRYLGDNYKGQLDTQNLYDTLEDRHRGLTLLEHQHRLASWDLNMRLAASQTRDFLNDFQQKKLVDSRERRLESRLTADRLWLRKSGYTNLHGGTIWYQNLDAVNDLYTVQRLPYLSFTDDRPLNGLQRIAGVGGMNVGTFQLHSDLKLDSFYQSSGDAAQRLDLAPEIQYWRALPIGRLSGALGVRETGYMIQGDPNQTGSSQEATATRESASMRLRLDLDLARHYGNGAYKHTLEPALQVAMVSSTRQSGLPNFDATLRHFSVSNLYDGTLYSGADRVSASQWLTYGVTSRLFGRQDGGVRNLASFTIGQRWAPEGAREYQGEQAFSPVVSGLEWYPSQHWSITMAGRYDPYQNELKSSESEVRYTDARMLVSLGYHRNKPETTGPFVPEGSTEPLEDLSLQAKVPFREHWLLKQQSDYSLETNGIKSWRTGLVYEQDCWSFELSGGQDLSSRTREHSGQFIGFFFTLRGLGGYGVSS